MTLTTAQLAAKLCVSQRRIDRWRRCDGLRPSNPINSAGKQRKKNFAYDWDEFRAWLAQHIYVIDACNGTPVARKKLNAVLSCSGVSGALADKFLADMEEA